MLKEICSSGVDGVALVSAILGAEDIEECKTLLKLSKEMVNA